MSRRVNRRRFLKEGVFAGAVILVGPGLARTYAANAKLDFAVIGVGGRAGAGVEPALGENCVAVAEPDMKGRGKGNVEKIGKAAPSCRFYTDYRRLFDAHKKLDAVWVGTPDHHHFPATMRALAAGAGVYCEKPLTWSVREARILREAARVTKAPTQMGNQGHSSESIRRCVEYIQAGRLGDVTRVDSVSNRTFSAKSRPSPSDPPAGMDWDAWIGPAPFREYHGGLHPFAWRGYLDFGTGSIGDMGCHTMDGAIWALKLDEAPRVEIEPLEGETTDEGFAPRAKIAFRFPARGTMPPVVLTWYNGQKAPRPDALEEGRKVQSQGTYYYGTKGVAQTLSHGQGFRLIPESFHQATEAPPTTIRRPEGGHTGDFLRSCRDRSGPLPSSNFEYGACLTEIALLGNLAVRVGETITYDFAKGETPSPKANALLAREPRRGWGFGYV